MYIESNTEFMMNPLTTSPFSLAQKLAYRMLAGSEPDKIQKLFTNDADFSWINTEIIVREQFCKGFIPKNNKNIKAICYWKDSFHRSQNDLSAIIWTGEGFKNCLGNGLNENGPGWYKIIQKVLLKFRTNKEGKLKICSFDALSLFKTLQPEGAHFKRISKAISTIPEFDLLSNQVTQPTAPVRASSTTYIPFDDSIKLVIRTFRWPLEGAAPRGEGEKIKKVIRYKIGKEADKEKIVSQDILKTKIKSKSLPPSGIIYTWHDCN